MLPLQDSVARRYPPIVVYSLVAVNVLVFFYQISLPPYALNEFILKYALVPSRYFGGQHLFAPPTGLSDYLPFITNMFLHGGWAHLLFNMWALWIFGPAVEDRTGPWRFLIFYLVCGVAASLAHAMVNADSVVPALGASGAISGVTGCYVRMFPFARLIVMVPVFFYPVFFELPAIVFAFFWFMSQIVPGIISLFIPSQGGGIAWWAHIGGFVAGWILVPFFKHSSRNYRPFYADEGRYGFLPDGSRRSKSLRPRRKRA